MSHPLQGEWDRHVMKNYNHGSTSKVFAVFLGLHGVKRDGDLGDHVLALKEEGLKRLPVVRPEDQHSWFYIFMKLPVSAWLARAIPNSVNRFVGKTEHERVEIFSTQSTRRLKGKAASINALEKKKMRKAAKEQGGVRLNIKVRERDFRTSWSTVK